MEQYGTKDVEASGEDGSTKEKATVTAQQTTETTKQAVELAPAAAAAATASDDDATDSKDDDGDGMTSLEYIKTYKLLPPFEVELILQRPLERTPFTDSYAFKALKADPGATRDDIALAFEEHEEEQDVRMRFRERVRRDYEADGCVTVSDEYVAMRVRNEEISSRLWEEAFADFDDEVAAFDNGVDVEEVAQ